MAIVAGALALTAKKLNHYCVYQTTTFTTMAEGFTLLTCKTISEWVTCVASAGVLKQKISTTTEPCINVPISLDPEDCDRTLRVCVE